ncbi:MAG: hypothetical protein WA789_02250 [Candidatus Acidiferrum sp.]
MKEDRKTRRRSEQGIALLIAIFVLLLVSVVAIALLVSSGTETALGANYRSSSTVYYAALAGLEEARGRLLPQNPNYFNNVDPSAVPTPFPLGQTTYVTNRLTGESVVPWDSSNQYYDNEYQSEFGVPASSASWHGVPSVWDNNAQGIPGPLFKWVRINAVTDTALRTEINYSTGYHPNTAVYYDPANIDYNGNSWPSMVVGPTATARQVLEITAFAALPNGSKKILQYLVTPVGQSLSFPAALTLDGPNVDPTTFMLPYGGQFYVDGTDTHFYSSGSGCLAGPNPTPNPVRAIGYANNDSSNTVITTVIGSNHGEYTGLGFTPAIPSVFYVGSPPPPGPPTLAGNMQTVSQLNGLAAGISQEADVPLTGPVTQSDSTNLMPAGMSATNPMTVVVNGDFTESGWNGTGYGTLLVTGTFTYDQNSSWNGVILVIGKGVFTAVDSAQRNGQINGAVLVAATVDSLGNPLGSLGPPTFNYNYQGHTQGNNGIYYSSCWIQAAQTASRYKVLSFHEIPQS